MKIQDLPARQRQVATLLAEGKSNREIASALGIAEKTVASHRARAFKALGVVKLVELYRKAVKEGVVE